MFRSMDFWRRSSLTTSISFSRTARWRGVLPRVSEMLKSTSCEIKGISCWEWRGFVDIVPACCCERADDGDSMEN